MPRGVLARAVAAAAALAATLALGACAGSDAVDQSAGNGFKFSHGNPIGSVYPVHERKRAESFTGNLLDGGKVTLSSMRGKVVVLNFWASWCIPCQTETPQFDAVYRQIHARGVDFLGVDTKDDRGNAQSFIKTNKITYPIAYDEEGEISLRLGNLPSVALPYTVLIDKTGRVAAVYAQRLSPVDLTRVLDKLLAEH